MTPSMRPPPRGTRRAGQKDRHRRPQQQRLLQSLIEVLGNDERISLFVLS